MIVIGTLLAILIDGVIGSAHAQQTPADTKCNDESALSWTMNAETDISHYHVYSANNPITEVDPTMILMTVPHPTTPGDVSHPLNSNLADGPKYFRVTANDVAGNESPLSNEAGCDYNIIPAAPGNVNIILKHNP
jgi:hypothetical protein